MKVMLKITIVALIVLIAASSSAEAGQKYRKHVHKGGKIHWHKKMTVKQYNRYLEKKYAKVYKPRHRGYVRVEFNHLLKLSGWPKKHWKKLYRVATCESGRRWSTGRTTYVGLMQHRVGNGGFTRKQLENPVINLIVARWLYSKRGWQPWPVCGKS